jgi:uncharacterized protein
MWLNRQRYLAVSRFTIPLRQVPASDLAGLLGTQNASAFPQDAGSSAAWRVRVDVVRFDSSPGDAITIDARWAVQFAGQTALLSERGKVCAPVAGGNDEALPAAHSRAFAEASRDIALAITT